MTRRNASGVGINRTAVLGILGAGCLLLYVVYSLLPENHVHHASSTWRRSPFIPLPKQLADLSNVPVKLSSKEITFTMGKNEKVEIFYREALPETGHVREPAILLVHGAGGSSLKWQDLGTMHLGASLGHRVIAADMPGWGQTRTEEVSDHAGFLTSLISELQLNKPVLVASSAAGRYVLPYLLEPSPSTCHLRASALVTIAPTYTEKYTPAQYHRCEIPVLITYGVKDEEFGLKSVGDLRNMPNNEIFPFEKAGHSAHYEFPEEWHTLVYNFLLAVRQD